MNAPIENLLRPYEARLNITHEGRNGDYVEPVPFDASDNDAWPKFTPKLSIEYTPSLLRVATSLARQKRWKGLPIQAWPL